jgi:sarcosine oxidase subunit gamma
MASPEAGVTLQRCEGRALALVSVRRNQLPALECRVQELFGVRLPDTPKCASAGSISFLWSGVGQWLAMVEGEDGTAFERRLRIALGDLASVTDQSDSRMIVRIAGPHARASLAKGVPIDLHASAFRAGDVAATTVAYIGLLLWQVDATPTYEFLVPRSYAAACWDWLAESAAEFGIQVAEESGTP